MKISRYTDADIKAKSGNRVITDHRDFNLQRGSRTVKNRLYPYVGGVYDSNMFGSIYKDTCNCGKVDSEGIVCQRCGSQVLSEEEKFRRYARIELPFYYVMPTKVLGLLNLIGRLKMDYVSALNDLGYSRLTKSSVFPLCELCQFDWDEENEQIVATSEITDETKSSYEGLELILKEHYSGEMNDFKTLVNRYLLVAPAAYRPANFNPFDPMTKISIPVLSSIYQSVVLIKDQLDELLHGPNQIKDLKERVAATAVVRRYVSVAPTSVSECLAPSQENIMRNTYSSRMENSGRAPIIGDPSLKLDEVRIPIHLAYEMLKVDFTAYLSRSQSIDIDKAELLYRRASESTMEIFKEYAATRRVFVNRPPTLHRYNILSFKLLTTDDYAIHFPISVVGPFNADYDGDALMFFLVDEDLQEIADANISPANLVYYEVDNSFIFKPNHEMIYGLTLATRLHPREDGSEIPQYMDKEDVFRDYENQVIEYPTDTIYFNGKLSSYAKLKLSDILGVDLEIIYGDEEINSKNVKLLLKYINSLPTRVDVYQAVLEHALKVINIEGATIPSISEILRGDDRKFDELKDLIQDSKNNPEAALKVEDRYAELIKEEVDSLSADTLDRIADSGRIKLSQVVDIMVPQLVVDSKGEYYCATNSLKSGLTEQDMRHHAYNNRALLALKQEMVPKGGYLSRQLAHAGQGDLMDRNGIADDLEGILIPRNKAVGRTTLTGEVLGKSDSTELVRVRSMVTASNLMITPDMISEEFNHFDHGSNIGLRLITSATGSLTQKGLSLKHGGSLSFLDPTTELVARTECTVKYSGSDKIEITDIETGEVLYHYVPDGFHLIKRDTYPKGYKIGFLQKMVGPDYELNQVIDLLGALATSDIDDPNAREKEYAFNVSPFEGPIHYEKDWIKIGDNKLPRDPRRLYYPLEGDYVQRFQIISSGVMNCTGLSEYCKDVASYYGCFRSQYLHLMPGTDEQVIELIFNSCHIKQAGGIPRWVGVKEKVREDKAWLSNLAYEGASSLVMNTLAQPEYEEDKRDLFSQFFINILQNV